MPIIRNIRDMRIVRNMRHVRIVRNMRDMRIVRNMRMLRHLRHTIIAYYRLLSLILTYGLLRRGRRRGILHHCSHCLRQLAYGSVDMRQIRADNLPSLTRQAVASTGEAVASTRGGCRGQYWRSGGKHTWGNSVFGDGRRQIPMMAARFGL